MMHALKVAVMVSDARNSAPPAQPALQAPVRLVLREPAKHLVVMPKAAVVALRQVTHRHVQARAQAPAAQFVLAPVRMDPAQPIAPAVLLYLTSNLSAYRLARPACKIRTHEYSS